MVVGSNPAGPTRPPVLSEELGLWSLAELLLGPAVRTKLELRNLPNTELFARYDADLRSRRRTGRGLREGRRLIAHFERYLGPHPPSAEAAKAFLGQYLHLKPRTVQRYVTEIKLFMTWYGEGFHLKVPRSKPLPQYTAHEDVQQLLDCIAVKKSHKRNIARDTLLVELAYGAGLRRGDLARLRVGDIRIDKRLIIIRQGKGQRDRVVPLTSSLTAKLEAFCRGKRPDESVFGLTDEAITNKIRIWSRKAGVASLHCHSLRHGFATRLLERGADIRQIQALLGHENLNTTQVYADLVPSRLRDAVELLDQLEPYARGEPVPPVLAATAQQAPVVIVAPEEPCPGFSWEIMAAGERDSGQTLVLSYD